MCPFLPAVLLGLGPLISSSPASELGLNVIGYSGSQAFKLNHTADFPGSPACRWQVMGLLCLHNCMSQLLIINMYPIGSISLTCPD